MNRQEINLRDTKTQEVSNRRDAETATLRSRCLRGSPLSRLRVSAVVFSAVALLIPTLPVLPQPQEARPTLVRKWEYKIMERVYLSQPSGWINEMPWLISSPAIGNLGLEGSNLQVVTGTEEGFGEWFPRGDNSGRYICVSSKGAKLWDYETRNNAGRASPAIVALKDDRLPVCTGGSTSGWMVHCFGRDGRSRWRYECANHSNVLSAPASGKLSSIDPGLQTVAVSAEGSVYCLDAEGKLMWKAQPAGASRGYAGAAPLIAEVVGDGSQDVVVTLPGNGTQRVYCLNGTTGQTRWASDVLAQGINTVVSSPAILPKSDS